MNATDATTPVTDAANAGDVTAIFCPECGDEVEDLAPENYLVPGVRPGYRHVSDRTALCPVMTAAGYRPAEPVEHQVGCLMAATTVRRRLTDEERAERVEALTAELAAAVEALTDSTGWRSMLEVSARFRRYSLNNQLLLWAQATRRGMTLTRVAAFGTWRKLGLSGAGGGEGPADLRPGHPAATRRRGGRVDRSGTGSVRPGRAAPAGRARVHRRVRVRPEPGRSRPGRPTAAGPPALDRAAGRRPERAVAGAGRATEAHGFTLDVRPARSRQLERASPWTQHLPVDLPRPAGAPRPWPEGKVTQILTRPAEVVGGVDRLQPWTSSHRTSSPGS